MISQDLKKYKIPDNSGVYFFLGPPKRSEGGKRVRDILYIGKATSLKDRVRSYFAGDLGETRGPKITQMLALANKLEWQETDSVLEALLLETELIKKHQPPYNTREKDDKSYYYVVITDEDFPRVLIERGRGLETVRYPISHKFGPFPYSSEIKEALKIIRKIFPYRDKCLPCVASLAGRSLGEGWAKQGCHPCFNRQLGLCPGVCSGEISKADYQKTIRNIKLFFAGQKKEVIKNLEREMKSLAKDQEFEKARQIRDQIFALNHIRDVSLIKNKKENSEIKDLRIEAYDIAHLSGQSTVGAMAVWQNGELDRGEARKFKLRGAKATQVDDPANLQEVLVRRFNHPEWSKPDIIVADGNQIQINVIKNILIGLKIKDVQVVGVVKDDKHKASKLLGDQKIIHDYHRAIVAVDAEVHRLAISYHRQLMRKRI